MHKIITVSREFGSGGRELGKRLAQELGAAYYDREIITAIAQRSGLAEKYVESVSERGVSAGYPITMGRTFFLRPPAVRERVDVMLEQQKILRELAEKSDSVFVGRCADVVLKEHRPLNLFIYADMDSRLRRCQSRQDAGERLEESDLIRRIEKIDRQRAKYREMLTGSKWGEKSAYHLCVNTTGLEIKKVLAAVVQFQSCYFEGGSYGNSFV